MPSNAMFALKWLSKGSLSGRPIYADFQINNVHMQRPPMRMLARFRVEDRDVVTNLFIYFYLPIGRATF
jgi:hypothetical protein